MKISLKNKNHYDVNYYYFTFALIYLIALSLFNIFSKEASFFGVQIYFFCYSIFQSFLEIVVIALLGSVIKKILPEWIYRMYIGCSFLFLFLHLIDFFLMRLMDTSILYAFKIFFAEGFGHFISAVAALNVNYFTLILFILITLSIPTVGVLFYWLTKKVSIKKPILLSYKQLFRTIFSITLTLFLLDFAAKPFLKAEDYSVFQSSLPLKTTFLSNKNPIIKTKGIRTSLEKEQAIVKKIQNTSPLQKKPNIFLFVVETLRKDYITPEIAPSLASFAKNHISPTYSTANANGTYLSWFSIFHSEHPHLWGAARKKRKQGSPPLQLLKKLGYKIRTYSSADLNYFHMNELIFGNDLSLADFYYEIPPFQMDPSYRDQKVMDKLQKDLTKKENQEGNVFLIFLDSTHSEYHWPKEMTPKFLPVTPEINYISLVKSNKNIEPVKNRYKNAIYYIDQLFKQFTQTLKKNHLWDSSFIVFTGDHGEEHFEEGALFHGTHLNSLQVSVPLFFKVPPPLSKKAFSPLASHVDIFPTLFHALTQKEKPFPFCAGESIFSANKRPFIFTVQQNGSLDTSEFSFYNGNYRLMATLVQKENEQKETTFRIEKIKNEQEKDVVISQEDAFKIYQKYFQPSLTQPL